MGKKPKNFEMLMQSTGVLSNEYEERCVCVGGGGGVGILKVGRQREGVGENTAKEQGDIMAHTERVTTRQPEKRERERERERERQRERERERDRERERQRERERERSNDASKKTDIIISFISLICGASSSRKSLASLWRGDDQASPVSLCVCVCVFRLLSLHFTTSGKGWRGGGDVRCYENQF